MAEDNNRKGLLDGRDAHTRPYTPPNEYDEALFHEKGKSPKEVRHLQYSFEVTSLLCAAECEGWRMVNALLAFFFANPSHNF